MLLCISFEIQMEFISYSFFEDFRKLAGVVVAHFHGDFCNAAVRILKQYGCSLHTVGFYVGINGTAENSLKTCFHGSKRNVKLLGQLFKSVMLAQIGNHILLNFFYFFT